MQSRKTRNEELASILQPLASPPLPLTEWTKNIFSELAREHHFLQHRDFVVCHSDSRRYDICCAFSPKAHKASLGKRERFVCNFRALLSKRKSDSWQIRHYTVHDCDPSLFSSDTVVSSMPNKYLEDCRDPPLTRNLLMAYLARHGYHISKGKASALLKKQATLDTCWNYSNLSELVRLCNEYGYPTECNWSIDLTTSKQYFRSLYCILGGEIWESLLPVLSIDDCHLTGALQGGCLLTICGIDIQKRLHIIAFAIVEVENQENINHLFTFLSTRSPGMHERFSGCVMADRGSALESINFQSFFLRKVHRVYCQQHLQRNIAAHHRALSDIEKGALYSCMAATSVHRFAQAFSKLDSVCQQYLSGLPREKWACCATEMPRFGILTNNCCECLNSAFKNVGLRALCAPELLVGLVKW